MTTQPLTVSVAPYAVRAYAAQPSAPPARAGSPNAGLLFAGAVFVFSSVLLLIVFAVALRAYLGLDAHWAANTSLTVEARELGLRAVKQAGLIRLALSGPAGLLLAVGGVTSLISGARRT